jgi:hypothetical protein
MNAASVCRRFETSSREEVVSFRMHQAITAIDDDKWRMKTLAARQGKGGNPPRLEFTAAAVPAALAAAVAAASDGADRRTSWFHRRSPTRFDRPGDPLGLDPAMCTFQLAIEALADVGDAWDALAMGAEPTVRRAVTRCRANGGKHGAARCADRSCAAIHGCQIFGLLPGASCVPSLIVATTTTLP